MNTLGSHPGAILFRFTVMVIIILILIRIFLYYADGTQRTYEQNSILQTKRIVDSTLAVVFSTYAIDRRLGELNDLDGANPFVFLEAYQMLPPTYQGVIERDLDEPTLAPGWYFLKNRGLVAYKARFLDETSYFRVTLVYDDLDRSGRFEPASDRFRNLQFVRQPRS